MNTPFSISLTVFAIAFTFGDSLATDLFDSAGPGYRQQAQEHRAAPRASFILLAPLPAEFFGHPPLDDLPIHLSAEGTYLSKPIRLFSNFMGGAAVMPIHELKSR